MTKIQKAKQTMLAIDDAARRQLRPRDITRELCAAVAPLEERTYHARLRAKARKAK